MVSLGLSELSLKYVFHNSLNSDAISLGSGGLEPIFGGLAHLETWIKRKSSFLGTNLNGIQKLIKRPYNDSHTQNLASIRVP